MINVYRISVDLKESTESIKNNIVKDYHTNEVQKLRTVGKFNFKLDSKYKDLITSLSKTFINVVNKTYNLNIINKDLDVWAYVSNKDYYNSEIHNHATTATINGVYYLNVPNAKGGELEFYDEHKNKLTSVKPKTNDLLIFDGTLNHKPLPCNSDEYRIALNIEIK